MWVWYWMAAISSLLFDLDFNETDPVIAEGAKVLRMNLNELFRFEGILSRSSVFLKTRIGIEPLDHIGALA